MPSKLARPRFNSPSALSLVRLKLAEPVIAEFDRRKLDSSAVLAEFSLKRDNLAIEDRFVPASTMYRLVERFAERSGDPYFGVRAGERLDPWSWPPTIDAVRHSGTVGEFLLRFMENAGRDVNSATFVLKTIGQRSTFHERRFSDGGTVPRHNDGFTIAYLLAMIRRAVGKAWDGGKVVARVADPAVVPPLYLGIRTAGPDTLGASVSFPANWLIAPLFGKARSPQQRSIPRDSNASAGTIVGLFRLALTPHIHEFDLNSDRVAGICGMSKRTLARKLQAQGTSMRKEIKSLKRERAESLLRMGSRSVSEIATQVGYADLAVFSRAFKRWTGLSPREYRKANQPMQA